MLWFIILSAIISPSSQGNITREDRLLNLFSIVTFPNEGCTATSGDTGLCLSGSECNSRGGSILGNNLAGLVMLTHCSTARELCPGVRSLLCGDQLGLRGHHQLQQQLHHQPRLPQLLQHRQHLQLDFREVTVGRLYDQAGL